MNQHERDADGAAAPLADELGGVGLPPGADDLWADDPASEELDPVKAWEQAGPPVGVAAPTAGQARPRPLSPWIFGAIGAGAALAAGAGVWFVAHSPAATAASAGWRALVGPGLAVALALALAGLAGWAATTLAERDRRERRRLADLLARVAGLDPDSDRDWEDPAFEQEPALARLLACVRARDRRQRAELQRAALAEGEASRLGASLVARERASVAASFETPAIGRIAAGAALVFEDLDQARRERAELAQRLDALGGQTAGAVAEARGWQAATARQVATLQAAVQALALDAQKLAAEAEARRQAADARAHSGTPGAADVQRALPAAGGQAPAAQLVQTAHLLKDLVARGGSLAIQTALEVTRLGDRGEALFPLTEGLKSLVTEFQGVATRLERLAKDEEAAAAALAKARSLLDALETADHEAPPAADAWKSEAHRAGEFKLALLHAGTGLGGLAQAFAEQAGRLEALAGALADLTGVPAPDPGEGAAEPAPFEVDGFGASGFATPPVTVAPVPGGEPDAAPVSPGFRPSEPLFAGEPASPEPPAPAAEPEGPSPQPEPASSGPEPAPTAPPEPLSQEEERIYDLAEFGAVALDGPPAGGPDEEDRVYDLTEFGAVALA